jgi:hypothetical protein
MLMAFPPNANKAYQADCRKRASCRQFQQNGDFGIFPRRRWHTGIYRKCDMIQAANGGGRMRVVERAASALIELLSQRRDSL